jgi:hypothetical protein
MAAARSLRSLTAAIDYLMMWEFKIQGVNISGPNEPAWKRFERLVTAIHKAESSGGVVKWNEVIDGRQFDATIRFEHAIYSYLTVIECKHGVKPVEVEDVDAFVTKSRSVGASKGVMVSSSGYQEGCYRVARENKVGLYTLTELGSV